MNLSAKQLKYVEELGGAFYTPHQIANIMELDTDEIDRMLANRNSEFYKHYWRGFYTSDYEHRQSVIKLAKMGSSPAQTMVESLIKQAKMNAV